MVNTEGVRLTKHHGAGNDFLVMLDRDGVRPLSGAEVRALCDRRRGVGADGVLRATAGQNGADLTMQLRNADGGEAEMSGNGIRCLVQAAVDAGWVPPGPVSVATGVGLRVVDYRCGDHPGQGYAGVDMGPVTLGSELLLDVAPDLSYARTVDVGNPHIVLFGPEVDDATVATVGPRLEHSVETRANVEFVWAGSETDELCLRVWERGVGETLACGTGTCAAVAAAHSWGLVGSRVLVHNPGGTLEVEMRGDGVWLAGPTQKVADIIVDASLLADLTALGGHRR
ncbi:MAG TPA: diaminopimelate epimerase [Acidimicrobiales bacterium]|nr:diaminopimelate epimerase [Acidimicrobiales bacterium]